jgi:uncharacterized protein
MGLYLMKNTRSGLAAAGSRKLGAAILAFCPWLMKGLSVVGTAAMFLVGGGILVHGIPALHHFFESLALPYSAPFSLLFNLMIGLTAGIAALGLLQGAVRVKAAL